MDILGKSDPFVTIRNGSGKEKFRSKVIYNSLNPEWNETCRVPLPNDKENMIIVSMRNAPRAQGLMSMRNAPRTQGLISMRNAPRTQGLMSMRNAPRNIK